MTDQQTILTLARALKNSDQAIMVDQLLNWQQEKAPGGSTCQSVPGRSS